MVGGTKREGSMLKGEVPAQLIVVAISEIDFILTLLQILISNFSLTAQMSEW